MEATTTTAEKIITDQAIAAWQLHNDRLNKLLATLSDAQLAAETAPGRNTGTWLLGHLIAVNDRMIDLLGLGERLYTELDTPFVATPDKSGLEFPSEQTLREYWNKLNEVLESKFKAMEPGEWMGRHTAVSEEDFAQNPQRNKLNILISRTNHQAYHMGQMAYLK